MFLVDKYKPDGTFDKIKARLVADGSQQGVHLYFVSSTTVSLQSVFLLLNIATRFRAKLNKIDIKGAFLRTPPEVDKESDPCIIIRTPKDIVSLWKLQDPIAKEYISDNGDL